MSDASVRLADAKEKAEACYSKMYESEPHNLKDWRDDACSHFAEAIRAAEELGLSDEKKALEARVEHVRGVFEQLRTDGGGRPPLSSRRFDVDWIRIFQWGCVALFLVSFALYARYRLSGPPR